MFSSFLSCDCTQESFDHVEEWLSEVDRYANENTVKLLVGNKADLVERKEVSEETAQVPISVRACAWLRVCACVSLRICDLLCSLCYHLRVCVCLCLFLASLFVDGPVLSSLSFLSVSPTSSIFHFWRQVPRPRPMWKPLSSRWRRSSLRCGESFRYFQCFAVCFFVFSSFVVLLNVYFYFFLFFF